MKVKWTEIVSASFVESMSNWFPDDFDYSELDKNYEGEVIGTTKGFWGDTYLTVACTDGEIRECHISKAKVLKS